MYSKKINQLATNLNPQETDLLPIGDAETGQLKTTTFGSVSGITGDGVISGGIVTWTGTGLIFNISACTYILNGIRYSSPFSTKTLAAADPTNARIDVFAVNTSGQVEVIQGTPASNPVEPEGDTATTLGLTNVTINAGATTPNNVTRDLIYDENVETWTKTQTVTGSFDYNNTAFAYTGSKSILVTMSAGIAYFNFSKAVALDISNYKSLSFAIRCNSAWTSNTILGVRFLNGSNNVSNLFQINASNNVGFNRNLAGQWQLITIPFNNTNLKFTNNAFTTIRISTQNAAVTYRLDTIQLNGGISNPTGGGTTPSNSFGFVNGSTGTASSTTATDTLSVVGSGLITTSATGKTLTIASNQIATSSILGRVTASTGNIETLTGTQATTLLNVFTSSLKGLAPASGGGTTNFLRADGTWAAPSGGGGMSLNGLTAQVQYFATGTSGTDFAISSATDTHTFNLPTASATNRGALSSADWTTFNSKVSSNIYTADGTLTSARTLTSGGYNLTFTGSNTASSAIARGVLMNHTLLASANSDVLVGLDINPIFTNGAFTGVANYAARFNGAFGSNSNLSISRNLSSNTALNVIFADNSETSIQNTSTNASIRFTLGGVNYGRFMPSTGNLLLQNGGTFTDAGFRLDVNGTTRLNGNLTTNLTLGSVTFISTSGLLAQDNANFFWDDTNNRLGIGTATPTADIDITKGVNAAVVHQIKNTTTGTSAQAVMNFIADTNKTAQMQKLSTSFGTPVAPLLGGDFAITNFSSGNMVFVNNFGTGNIKFTSGGGSVAQMTLTAAARVLIGTTTEDTSALLNVTSTTNGFLPPRMTTTQKNAIGTPAAGLIVYDTTLAKLCVRTASAWETITSL